MLLSGRSPRSGAPGVDERLALTPERELTLLMAGTRRRRDAAGARVTELVGSCDFALVEDFLRGHSLLPLLGKRLHHVLGAELPSGFRAIVEAEVERGRYVAAVQESVTLELVAALERSGIPAVALKGPLLARDIHGDSSLRTSVDIDVLVAREWLPASLELLAGRGYSRVPEPDWEDDLPILHHTLQAERAWQPELELHWRIHWYERRFSDGLLARSSADPDCGRRAKPVDELAALLLFYARDSFSGLRLPVDLAAWWDAHGSSLPSAALDPLLDAHPELRACLVASAVACEELVGVPGRQLFSDRFAPSARTLAAVRLANWTGGDPVQAIANMLAVDWLLSPPSARRGFFRRYLFQPTAAIAEQYGRSQDGGARLEAERAARGTARTLKFAGRYARARWLVRGERRWSPRLPAVSQPNSAEEAS
jgi:putative nucleotidyltransferase-like protein